MEKARKYTTPFLNLGGASWLIEWIPITHTEDPQWFDNVMPAEILTTCTERIREKMKWEKTVDSQNSVRRK